MAQRKAFNVTGPCVPALHYMVDTGAKIEEIIDRYVYAGEYFTINRARQYGKTTTLGLLERALAKTCIPISVSFEGFGASVFSDEDRFIRTFIRKCAQSMEFVSPKESVIDAWRAIDGEMDFAMLGDKITDLARNADRRLVLMIDEVDKSSNNQLFLDFLGLLRNKYIERAQRGTPTFHSVVLAGVYDVKNLRLKLRPEERHSYNSPWNIAARFDVDMSFSAPEIASMLAAYERDRHTGMDVAKVSERLHYYTGGYPFLVSLLCKTMDDDGLAWTGEGVDEAEKRVVRTSNTLFGDVIKNLVNNSAFATLVERIVLRGAKVAFEIHNPNVDLGMVFGIFSDENGSIRVSNIIFETVILNYLISTAENGEVMDHYVDERGGFVHGGKLDMSLVLNRFSAFMRSEYHDEDGAFIEREGRLLFLSFLKPIINGTGHYVVEPETRGSRRMDVVVFYGGEEHIVELKIWRGEQAASGAYDQLVGYLRSREQKKGYLLSFCDNQTAPREGRIFSHNGCEIVEVIVTYRDKA